MKDNFYIDKKGKEYHWNGKGYYNSEVNKYFVFFGRTPGTISPEKLKSYSKKKREKNEIEKKLSNLKNTPEDNYVLKEELEKKEDSLYKIEKESIEREDEDLLRYQKELKEINNKLSYIETTDDEFDYLNERKHELEKQIDALDISKPFNEKYSYKNKINRR